MFDKVLHTCRFSTLTINFSQEFPRQILELGKQFNLMIRLQNILKASLQDVLKMSWRCLEGVLKTFWRHLEDVLKTSSKRFEDVFKTYWRRLGKTSWRRLEDAWPRRIYWSWSRRLEDAFWRQMTKVNIFVLIKTSWKRRRKTSWRRLQDVFIKANVCWEGITIENKLNFN